MAKCQSGWHGGSHVARVPRRGGSMEFLTSGSVEHGMGNLSANGRRMALVMCTATKLPEIYLGSIKGKSLETERLTNFNAALRSLPNQRKKPNRVLSLRSLPTHSRRLQWVSIW